MFFVSKINARDNKPQKYAVQRRKTVSAKNTNNDIEVFDLIKYKAIPYSSKYERAIRK